MGSNTNGCFHNVYTERGAVDGTHIPIVSPRECPADLTLHIGRVGIQSYCREQWTTWAVL